MKTSFTLLAALLIGCLYGKNSFAQSIVAERKLPINLDNAVGGLASTYLQNVEFITFDVDPKAAFRNIDQLEITDSNYIILDRDTKSVLVFDKKGKFYARIDARVINPQRPNFYSFSYEDDKKTISINFKNQIITFDLKGNILERKQIPMLSYRGTELYLGAGVRGYYMYSPQMHYSKKDTLAFELMVTKNDLLTNKYLPYKTGNLTYDSNGSQAMMDFSRDSLNSGHLYFTREYDYNVYKLSKNRLSIPFGFIFPVNVSLPKDFITDTAYNNQRLQFITKNKNIVFKVSRFYTSGDNILFKTISADLIGKSYIYGLSSSRLMCINNIISDASTYYLPVTDAEVGGYDFVNRGILASDGQSFYTSYSSSTLFEQALVTKYNNMPYPEQLKNYLSDANNQQGSPVLIKFKIKP